MVKSTLCSIIIFTVFCRFSNAIDWDKCPHGELMKSEVIFSVPNNVILGEMNGDNITDEQYHLAMKIRSYKLLYLLVNYEEGTILIYGFNRMKDTIISSSDYIIEFMKQYNIDISDLEDYIKKILNSDLSEELYFSFKEFLRSSLFEQMINFNKKLSIETKTDDFNSQLNESINSWKIFYNLYNEETKKYIPPNTNQIADCIYATSYFNNKISTEYTFKPSKYMKLWMDLKAITYIEKK
ncbi:uncharacterized protein LOC126896117 [Daktulosphaira vitifoliae]|uniref:uncharacterized protein LOC126896117 n=1 Tax=Daktulosphaira vitifoliae TaxID=58002 RepID=UPI0021AA18BF|nr:uncharacterized protein LOC126896117 [Daktulosphaira vitifoliae]